MVRDTVITLNFAGRSDHVKNARRTKRNSELNETRAGSTAAVGQPTNDSALAFAAKSAPRPDSQELQIEFGGQTNEIRVGGGRERRGRRDDRRAPSSITPLATERVASLRDIEVRRRLTMLAAFLPAWINEAHLLFVPENAELFRDESWRPEYSRWVSAEHAIQSAHSASKLAVEIAELSDEGEGRLLAAVEARQLEQERLAILLERGWPEQKRTDGIELPIVREWVAARAALLALPMRRFDPRVHFERRRIHRRLSESENHIMPQLPPDVQRVIGPLNDTGRSTLAYVLEGLVGYVRAEDIVDETNREKAELSTKLTELMDQVREHDIAPPEARLDLYGWRGVAGAAKRVTAQAREAASALTRQKMRDAITTEAHSLFDRWTAAVQDSPALDSWSATRGREFTLMMTALEQGITAEGVDALAAMLNDGSLQQLAGAIQIALHAHDEHGFGLRDDTLAAHSALSITQA
jgi:hypothetical protein